MKETNIEMKPLYKKPKDVADIYTYPEDKDFLRMVSNPTTDIFVENQKLVEKIREALPYAWTPGLGLAAIQIGYPVRMAWYSIKTKEKEIERTLINPEIIERDGLFLFNGEGCLSVPEKRFAVDRYLRVVVQNGKDKFEATGLEAVIIQHEIDHMDGMLCFDRGHKNEDKTGRNEPCPCGSGKKYKKCCLK